MQFDPNDLKNTIHNAAKSFPKSLKRKGKATDDGKKAGPSSPKDDSFSTSADQSDGKTNDHSQEEAEKSLRKNNGPAEKPAGQLPEPAQKHTGPDPDPEQEQESPDKANPSGNRKKQPGKRKKSRRERKAEQLKLKNREKQNRGKEASFLHREQEKQEKQEKQEQQEKQLHAKDPVSAKKDQTALKEKDQKAQKDPAEAGLSDTRDEKTQQSHPDQSGRHSEGKAPDGNKPEQNIGHKGPDGNQPGQNVEHKGPDGTDGNKPGKPGEDKGEKKTARHFISRWTAKKPRTGQDTKSQKSTGKSRSNKAPRHKADKITLPAGLFGTRAAGQKGKKGTGSKAAGLTEKNRTLTGEESKALKKTGGSYPETGGFTGPGKAEEFHPETGGPTGPEKAEGFHPEKGGAAAPEKAEEVHPEADGLTAIEKTEGSRPEADGTDAMTTAPVFGTGGPTTAEAVSSLPARAGQSIRHLLEVCLIWWRFFFASLVRKVGYTLAATMVVAVVAALLGGILFLSMAGSGNNQIAETGTASEMAPEEGAEAAYDGIAPADEAGTTGWSQTLPGQTVGAEGNQALANAFRGLFSRAQEAAGVLKQQAEDTIRSEYMEILDSGKGAEFTPESGAQERLWEQVREERREKLQEEPLLLLVNKWHYLPEDYEVEAVDLDNGQQISSICYDQLMEMLRDCAEAGGTPIVCSGFRPHEKQVFLFDEQIKRWLNQGCGQEEAEAMAATAVAVPGTSEHELGLAADIYSSENMSLDESQVDTFTQQWLMEHCWEYGFVLRYPKDKNEITGIIFEPWHYRYVGKEHAEIIHKAGICLEEYLDQAEHEYSPLNPFDEPREEDDE
ncbi:MAG: M15 family metallopeptidase [Eubacteriales bacterium]|nr:M15 family metallopeptidase [Eubacteriales bacterium]